MLFFLLQLMSRLRSYCGKDISSWYDEPQSDDDVDDTDR